MEEKRQNLLDEKVFGVNNNTNNQDTEIVLHSGGMSISVESVTHRQKSLKWKQAITLTHVFLFDDAAEVLWILYKTG